jgi:Xaa-Pro aminopeptidase
MSRFSTFDYADRIERARTLMANRGIGALMLSVGADLPYFTGYEAMPLERLTMLVVAADGPTALVVPRLEAPRVDDRGFIEILAWDETDDPVGLAASLAGNAERVALGDTTWSTFLLQLQATMPQARFGDASPLTRELRMRKEPAEIGFLRAAAEATDRVVVRLETTRFSGRTESDLAAEIRAMTVEEGHDVATFDIVASGPNAASPHHEPTDRIMQIGDSVVVDFGGRHAGYCSDTTRTFSIGEPAAEVADAYSVLQVAQAAGRAAVAPGVTAESVDAATRRVIDEAGYGDLFFHRTGHGIGLEGHEHPYIVDGNDLLLETGMAFSIEPGIYQSGRWGMRIEDIVVCGDSAVDELNRSDRQLRVVD